jgi:hypothetical protein
MTIVFMWRVPAESFEPHGFYGSLLGGQEIINDKVSYMLNGRLFNMSWPRVYLGFSSAFNLVFMCCQRLPDRDVILVFAQK